VWLCWIEDIVNYIAALFKGITQFIKQTTCIDIINLVEGNNNSFMFGCYQLCGSREDVENISFLVKFMSLQIDSVD
jgi:hypothetical protein